MQVQRTVSLAAPMMQVWQAVTDPRQLSRWMGLDIDLEPRLGARGTVRGPGGQMRMARVTELCHGKRYAFRWWPVGPGGGRDRATEVLFELSADEKGTRLLVVERRAQPATPAMAADAWHGDTQLVDA